MARAYFALEDYERAERGVRPHLEKLANAVSWQTAKLWSVHRQIVRTRNSSNLSLNEYRRTETSLSLMRAF